MREFEMTGDPTREQPLRLWPGLVIVALQGLAWLVVLLVGFTALPYGILGGVLGLLLVMVWWAFFSRAPRPERWGAVLLMIVGLGATALLNHESMRLRFFVIYPASILSLAFVVWAVASRRLAAGHRRAAMVGTILLACLGWTLVRSDGITGSQADEFHWRWTKTPEQRLLAQSDGGPLALPPAVSSVEAVTDWPGFRGPDRDGVIRGVRIATDWSTSPPEELWRRRVGPAWSSFAIHGDLLYTQEQRGEDETVGCYSMATGEPVWRHADAARFYEPNAGAGPRGTPTLSNGRVYTFGATGILNALDAANGTLIWSRDVASDTGKTFPFWGFSSSPLVIDDVVIVAASTALVAYDVVTGQPRWHGPPIEEGAWGTYSSPHLSVIDGVTQVLLQTESGTVSVAPSDGTLLWEYSWPVGIVQPARTVDGDVLLSSAGGVRRIAVTRGSDGWTTEKRWGSNGLKPEFNHFVVHDGHAFGFDGSILSCIDLEDGERKWKGGRYGHGQLVLLADQDLLLVVSEQGEVALVPATPEGFTELARLPAVEGKTWNHPVVVDDVLLVRNGREMVAYRLSVAQ